MNWLNLLYLLPLALLYWLFLSEGHGYRLIHSEDKLLSAPEMRFRYSEAELASYFDSIQSQEALTRLWRWKYLATAIFLLVMIGIPFNFPLPEWLRTVMLCTAGLRALLALGETLLLSNLQKHHLAGRPLASVKIASLFTSLKWCVTGLWILCLFGFLVVRAALLSKS